MLRVLVVAVIAGATLPQWAQPPDHNFSVHMRLFFSHFLTSLVRFPDPSHKKHRMPLYKTGISLKFTLILLLTDNYSTHTSSAKHLLQQTEIILESHNWPNAEDNSSAPTAMSITQDPHLRLRDHCGRWGGKTKSQRAWKYASN